MNDAAAPCETLAWDSSFFGAQVARARASRLDPDTCRAMLAWCQAHRVDCLYFLADEDAGTRRLLEEAAFTRVDERVTLERDVPPDAAPPPNARPARLDDIPALGAIAAVSHRDSRFYHDGSFDAATCDRFYRAWIENSCLGWADHVVVVDGPDGPAGYLTIHVRTPASAAIGLLAVSPSLHRLGLGRTLIDGGLAWLAGRSVPHVSVVTQGRNLASLAFYRNVGFHISGTATWYHRWFRPVSNDRR